MATTLDLLLSTSRSDQHRQLRGLVGTEVRYRGRAYRVIDAMGTDDNFGLFLQEAHPSGIPTTLVVSGDDLRGIQLP
jgi:hypothetical protein